MSKNRNIAKIVVSGKPDDDIVRKIADFVEKLGCDGVKYVIDPEIIGGIVIRVGDKVYDGSVRTRLETIRQAL